MNSVLYMIIMTILWIANLFNGTGLGEVYQTTERLRIIIYIVFVFMAVISYKKGQHYINKRYFTVFFGLFFVFVFSSYIQGYGLMGLHYLSAFALIYILSKIDVREKAVRLTAYVYLILGIVVLYIFDYGTIFAGWNPNTIGMIGLYSYLVFLIPFYNSKNKLFSNVFLIAITLLYMGLIEPTNSRSCTWFAAIAVLLALSFIPQTIIVKGNKKYFWLLLIPFFVAVIIVLISQGSYMQTLNLWSIKKFKKPLFNGRDGLWEVGFQLLFQNFLFGRGTLEGNWHNCMISILTAYGITGGLLWIFSLNNIMESGKKWLNDAIVPGCIISFFIMYIQQSVELGLVHESPNLLPYIVLGMMLGRIKFLRKKHLFLNEVEENDKSKYYYTGI